MGNWKFTATPQDINGKNMDTVRGHVSGPDPSVAREVVRGRVREEASACSVEVFMDDFDLD
ncbi:hypothetical protein OG418_19125 [Streptomyces phaeochromogenes]|uniref:hypothetical protein n=1 Tax=Streptomyces phaeochromogenes TaxID=1923 RepID=UPI0032522336